MPTGSHLSTKENLELASKRKDVWDLGLKSCEYCWQLMKAELKRKNLRKVGEAAAENIIHWHDEFKERFGREAPLAVCAAAAFRRDFFLLVSWTLPDLELDFPVVWDETDEAIGRSRSWNDAIQVVLLEIDKLKEAISSAQPKWQITIDTPPEVVLSILRKYDQKRSFRVLQAQDAGLKKPTVQPLAESGYLLIPADRINKATIEALTTRAIGLIPTHQLEPIGIDVAFWGGHTFGMSQHTLGRDQVIGVVGFRHKPEEHIWQFLNKYGAIAIKAQYALWARAYAQTDATPGVYISLTISQFCDDIGFAKKKRAHTLKSKQAAITVLELLTELELVCVYQPPKGPPQRIRGPIWARGVISEELLGYKDLFHSISAKENNRWIPKAFSYAPGPFFENEAWRKYNHYIALVGEGLLKLRSDNTDKYAVMIGGYLAILARMNGYRSSRIIVQTLLEKTGLWKVDGTKNPGRMRKKLEDALDRLREVGVIRSWDITSFMTDTNVEKLDDVSKLGELSEPTRWAKLWLAQTIIVDWPEAFKNRELKLRVEKERHKKRAALKRRKSDIPTV